MVQFVRADISSGTAKLGARLAEMLATGHPVLWLVSGGSNIPVSVEAMRQVPAELTKRLTIMPADERFGPVGHVDSNVRQLQDAGFDPKHATFVPVLDGGPLAAATDAYARRAVQLLAENKAVIGQFGIGADGHIAGILPQSPAAQEATKLATSYQGPDFIRLTLTFPALRHTTATYVFAYGANKREALDQVRGGPAPLDMVPARILHAMSEVYVYNDQVEEEGSRE